MGKLKKSSVGAVNAEELIENVSANDETVDADRIMQEFDRESNTRVFTGWRKKVMTTLMVLFSVYMVSMALIFPTATKYTKLTSFMAFICFIGYLTFPLYKKQTKKINYVPFYDIILACGSAGVFLYYCVNQNAIIRMSTRIGKLEIVVALLAIILLVELVRRAVGLPIIFVAGAFIVYAVIKAYSEVPKTALRDLMYSLFYDVSNGLFSTPVYVCTTFIVLFIILGALLERTGIGTFFVDLANSIAGSSMGGPAKVAVISSALEGMYSGSSVANTVGSGSITIPMMKKTGYKPEFAAAVEAAASTGGQIMPPIMGAAAFLMAEMTEVPYATIAITAILPAVLYFSSIFIMIHFEAKKLGLKGLPKEAIPNFFKLVVKNGYLLLPIVLLVICMNYFSAGLSACYAIFGALVVSLLPQVKNKFSLGFFVPIVPVAVVLTAGPLVKFFPFINAPEKNFALALGIIVCVILSVVLNYAKKPAVLTPSILVQSFENGAKNTIGVATACGMAGLISGVVTMTALGQLLINTLVPIANNSSFLALFLTMLCCIVLGMGVPTTANYVIMATITAPILIKMGIPALAAHMFVFYFGIVADITPPVALAAYAGSAIAKSNPLKTGITATRLAIAAFIIPYIFAYNPHMLEVFTGGVPWYEAIMICFTSLAGVFGISTALEGFMLTKMPWWQRIIAIAGGLMLIIPETVTDITGLAILAVVIIIQIISKKRAKTHALPVEQKQENAV